MRWGMRSRSSIASFSGDLLDLPNARWPAGVQEKEVVAAHMQKVLGPMMSMEMMFSNATVKLMKLQAFEVWEIWVKVIPHPSRCD